MAKRLILFVVCMTLFAVPSIAGQKKIYVWRDAKGVLVFSDTPQKGSEELNLNINTVDMQAVDTSILYKDESKPDTQTQFSISITEPKDQATIRDNTGSIYVSGKVSPRFESGLSIQLYLDGMATQAPKSSAIFALRNVERGEHKLQLKLIDAKGKEIGQSEMVTIYLHRKGL